MQFLTDVAEFLELYIPPPLLSAELPENVQFVTVGDDSPLYIPEPKFPENVQLVTVSDEDS